MMAQTYALTNPHAEAPWLLLCYLHVPFHQLASPPGFRVTHIPKGNLVYIQYLYVWVKERRWGLGGVMVMPML